MRVLMLVWTDVAHDARVLREATALVEAGHQVHVVGRAVPEGWAPPAGVTVASVGAASALQAGRELARRPGALAPLLRAARWALLPTHVGSALRRWTAAARPLALAWPADVVHAHDFTTLELGVEVAAAHRARLVYDAHELWWGRQRTGRPTPLAGRRERRVERTLAAKADAVLTVGDGIADQLRQVQGLDPVVVRNSFPRRPGAQAPERPSGVLYAGRVGGHRDLETVVAVAGRLEGLQVVLAGPEEDGFTAALPADGSVERHGLLTIPEVDALYARVGLGLVTLPDGPANHRLAMPNKLFHAVACGVPVVASDMPELRRVVEGHGIGVLYRPGDPESLAGAVRQAVARYPQLVAAVRAAAAELSWESDRDRLLGVYARLARG